jgi:hypothetical protein
MLTTNIGYTNTSRTEDAIELQVRVCSCERGPVFRVPIGDIKTRQVPFVWLLKFYAFILADNVSIEEPQDKPKAW